MYNENIHVYIFAAPIYRRGDNEYLRKASEPITEERREFLDTVLKGDKHKLVPEQISLLTPKDWLSGNTVNPGITYSSDACTSLVKIAREYLFSNGIVEHREALDALGRGVTLDNWSHIVHITYFVDTTAKTAIRKL